jgi:glycerol-3-phosphate acyltransferase PlsY
MSLLLTLLSGYLIGSIPFAVLIAGGSGRFDARREGTRNPGATNVFKNVGRLAGAAVGLLDYFKALLPAIAAQQWLHLGFAEATAVAFGAVLGHNFSIFLKFRGGKGGASTLGVFSWLDFPALLGVGLLWAVALPFLRGRRFVSGPAALSLFPILITLHSHAADPPLPGWVPPQPGLAIATSVALVVLLWIRIVPGLLAGRKGLPG